MKNDGTTGESSRELTFDDFKELARRERLSSYEKIGFPRAYREGKEEAVFQDIRRKLPKLDRTNCTILEIGPGCSGPALMMVDWCKSHGHQLILVDSDEMLSHIPDQPFIKKVPGRFPDQSCTALVPFLARVDVIVCYSVLHYIFGETNLFTFIDTSMSLLSYGGEMLIGDIPNVSKRKRFFASPTGIEFHRRFMQTEEAPTVKFNTLEAGKLDDSVLLSLVMRVRAAGCDAYLLPQPDELPMANRREDILIRRP